MLIPPFDISLEPCNHLLQEDFLKKYRDMIEWYDNNVTRNERIWYLSQPRNVNCEKPKMCVPKEPRKEVEMSVRLEQLSLPNSRYTRKGINKILKHSKELPKELPVEQKNSASRIKRRSLWSIYSHLTNLKPIENLLCKNKTPNRHATKNSLGIEVKHNKTIAANNKKEFLRTSKLAEPKKRLPKKESYQWELTQKLKHFIPSKRLQILAQPVQRKEPLTSNIKLMREINQIRLQVLALPRKIITNSRPSVVRKAEQTS